MKLALVLGLIGATSAAYASPYYVGQNLQTPNHITLGFSDAPIKDKATLKQQSANIAELNLRGSWAPMENLAIRAGLPFYFASSEITGSSRNTVGNVNLGAGWHQMYTSDNHATNYGWALAADVFTPTSRKVEGGTAAYANPTTDLYTYATKSTTLTPTAGAFVSQDMWSAKMNIGYGYTYVEKSAALTTSGTKKNRNSITWQTAASWHALPNMNVNLEYNTIWLDSASRYNRTAFRHAVTPSVSGNYDAILASVFATFPLDKATRDTTNVAMFGLNAGYAF